MENVLSTWDGIQNGEIQCKTADNGTGDVYLTDKYVFKTGENSEIWTNMHLNKEANRQGVNVPTVIDWSREEDVVVYERIEGKTLEECNTQQSLRLSSKVGNQLHTLHQHDYSTFGQLDDCERLEGEFQTYQAEIDRMTTKCERQSGDSIFDAIAETCLQTIRENQTPFTQNSSLVHNDYHAANIIYSNGDVVMLDLGGAKLCAPETDFVHSYLSLQLGVGSTFADRFARGYGAEIESICDVNVCMGVLRQIEVARYWERKPNGRTPIHKKQQLEDFLDDRF